SVEGSGCPKLGRSAGTGRAFLHAPPMPCRTHRHWWGRHCPGIRTQESCWVRIIVALEGSDQSASGLVLPAHPQEGWMSQGRRASDTWKPHFLASMRLQLPGVYFFVAAAHHTGLSN